jgi:hypothetical protein
MTIDVEEHLYRLVTNMGIIQFNRSSVYSGKLYQIPNSIQSQSSSLLKPLHFNFDLVPRYSESAVYC